MRERRESDRRDKKWLLKTMSEGEWRAEVGKQKFEKTRGRLF